MRRVFFRFETPVYDFECQKLGKRLDELLKIRAIDSATSKTYILMKAWREVAIISINAPVKSVGIFHNSHSDRHVDMLTKKYRFKKKKQHNHVNGDLKNVLFFCWIIKTLVN